MANHLKKSDVRYLIFQGGGGRGFAYLGAIRELEKQKILPVSRGQIRGVAGASAGAIMALLVALDYSSDEIIELFHSGAFEKLYENPAQGVFRVIESNKPKELSRGDRPEINDLLSQASGTLAFLLTGQDKLIAQAMIGILINLLKLKKDSRLATLLAGNPEGFARCLLADFGFFSGAQVRALIAGIFKKKMIRGDINFTNFSKVTHVNFVVTGTNLVTRSPGVFSAGRSGVFNVAEAVGISMSLPGVFKPVLAGNTVPGYDGMWIDGGTINNFPLHVFDEEPVNYNAPGKPPHGLHPQVLGFRLLDKDEPTGREPLSYGSYGNIQQIGDYFGALYKSIMYPANSGQVFSPDDLDQIIDLYPDPLTLAEFSPELSDLAKAVTHAQIQVQNYFT